jgi:serine/threonine protein kinase
MAPELVAKKDYLGQPVDVWALGVLLYKMLTGYYPFNGKIILYLILIFKIGKTDKELFHAIRRGKFRMPEHITSSA